MTAWVHSFENVWGAGQVTGQKLDPVQSVLWCDSVKITTERADKLVTKYFSLHSWQLICRIYDDGHSVM